MTAKRWHKNRQDVTQSQFWRGVQLVWIQFSFSLTGYHTKVKEFSLPNYLPKAGGKNRKIDDFPKGISMKWNANRILTQLVKSISIWWWWCYAKNAFLKTCNLCRLLIAVKQYRHISSSVLHILKMNFQLFKKQKNCTKLHLMSMKSELYFIKKCCLKGILTGSIIFLK